MAVPDPSAASATPPPCRGWGRSGPIHLGGDVGHPLGAGRQRLAGLIFDAAGAALAGKPHGGAAYGYTRHYDQHDRKVYVDVPDDRAPIVREIVERCAREEPLKHIVEDLNARGIPSAKGGSWTSRVVKQFATHPRYIGLRSHNGELHQGNWNPIVDEDVFHRAVAVLTAPDRKAAAPAAKMYFLSYLTSAPCGGLLNVQPESKHRPARYRCNDDGCVSVRADDLDEVTTRIILKRLARPDARGLFMPPDDEASAAQAEVARLQARHWSTRYSHNWTQPCGASRS